MPVIPTRDAVARFGHAWQVYNDDGAHIIREVLGHAPAPCIEDLPLYFATFDEAVAVCLERNQALLALVEKKIRFWEGVWGNWRADLLRFRMRHTLMRRSTKQRYEQGIARSQAAYENDKLQAERLRRLTASRTALIGEVVQELPETVNLPYLLEVGRLVWQLTNCGHDVIPVLRTGTIEKAEITSLARNGYDWGVVYTAFGSQVYHDHETLQPEVSTGYTNIQLYLTAEGARSGIIALLAEVRARTAALEASLASL